MNKHGLVVFAKLPEPGFVKTRLGKSIGMDKSAAVYSLILNYLLSHLSHSQDFQLILYLTGPLPDTGQIFQKLPGLKKGTPVKQQPEGDLGQKMGTVLLQELAGFNTIGIVGTDFPLLSPNFCKNALNFSNHDACLGPTYDGGYYLIALNQNILPKFQNEDVDLRIQELFNGIEWSTSEVYKKQCDNFAAMAANINELPKGRDIDELEDLRFFLDMDLNTSDFNEWLDPMLRNRIEQLKVEISQILGSELV